MNVKVVIATLLVFLIALLIYVAPKIQTNFGFFPRVNVNAPSGFDILALLGLKKTVRQNVLISTDNPSGLIFNLPNVTLRMKGICKSSITMGGVTFNLKDKKCDIVLYNSVGTIKFLNKNTVMTNIKFSSGEINSIKFSSSSPFISEIVLTDLLTPVSINKVGISNFTGKITTMTSSGQKIGEMNFPPCNGLKWDTFIGTLNFKKGNVYLSGVAKNLEYKCD